MNLPSARYFANQNMYLKSNFTHPGCVQYTAMKVAKLGNIPFGFTPLIMSSTVPTLSSQKKTDSPYFFNQKMSLKSHFTHPGCVKSTAKEIAEHSK